MRRSLSCLAAAAAALPLAVALPAQAAPAARTAAVARAASSIDWGACRGRVPRGDQCATLQVPLDYDQPDGPTIGLALIKQPATDPQRRIGSLLVNPGGPGGSGVDLVAQAGPFLLTKQVRARFDMIGFDPRGIAGSTPLRCFTSVRELDAASTPFPYPDTTKQERLQVAADDALRAACAENGGPILDHMATADVARDMDTIRQSVGDDALSYYGVSYGSYLGNTYANLFPGKVRALVIDGVLDPVAWTGTSDEGTRLPFSTRLHSALGAAATLDQFFALCDAGGPNCAFAPHAADRYAALYRALARRPVVFREPDGFSFRYDEQVLVSDTLGNMYGSDGWPFFADELADLEARVARHDSAGTRSLDARIAAAHARFAQFSNGTDQFAAVACSDSINPYNPAAWPRAARRDGLFGPLWTWASSPCAHWPGHDADRYLGPFTHRTANPVLVVGNQYDPATPYQGAQTAARLLPNARLLTVHGWGHTSLFVSRCATAAIGRYLVTTRTPAAGTVCDQDVVPFRQPEAGATAAASVPAAVAARVRQATLLPLTGATALTRRTVRRR